MFATIFVGVFVIPAAVMLRLGFSVPPTDVSVWHVLGLAVAAVWLLVGVCGFAARGAR